MILTGSRSARCAAKERGRSLCLSPLPEHDVQSLCTDMAHFMVDPISCELGRNE
jgi:hypothetical protein